MPLTTGDKLGHYAILASIGKGGMGEVYRAHDPRVGRNVAIKVCADAFTERFEREARAIAALNHSSICQLYDVGPNYLVMELVDGDTLSEVIRRGPIAFDESLHLGRQIADALQAAHQKGIIHRDLKPGNIKVRPDGTVKVLDFGLAKISHAALSGQDDSSVATEAATQKGVIMGTPCYMSPEQARGKPIDKRTDIWAFGAVLYEMLTGKPPFKGETATDTIAAVVSQEPDWTRLPVRARRLVKVCLQKDPSRRLHDIADVKLLLEEGETETEAERPRQSKAPWIVAAVLAIALTIAWWSPWETPPPTAALTVTEVPIPENVDAAGKNFTLSPDGLKLAFSAEGSDGVARVWVRFLDSRDVRPLPGTETTGTPPPFFWSADSRFVAYSSRDAKLKKVDLVGSPPQTLSNTVGPNAPGGAWNTAGVIIFGSGRGPLHRVPESGEVPIAVTALDVSRNETRHAFPTFLSDERRFLYLRTSKVPENSGVFIGSLDKKPEEQESSQLVATTSAPVYVASSERGRGYLLIYRDGYVLAHLFDEDRTEMVGEPVKVVEQKVGYLIGSAFFSASKGVLVYRPEAPIQGTRMKWWDRNGAFAGEPEQQPKGISSMALSSGGDRAALVLSEPGKPNGDIWTLDLKRGNRRRVTFDPRIANSPVWSPDSSYIVFASNREGPWNLYRKPLNESTQDEAIWKSGQDKTPTSISGDGGLLLYTESNSQMKKDIWVLSNLEREERKSAPFLQREFNESEARFSPGTGPLWVAYTADESGRNEVYVREYAPAAPSEPLKVSQAGGSSPRWGPDGKELFFSAPNGDIMKADMNLGGMPLSSGLEVRVTFPGIRPVWDLDSETKRFLVLVDLQQATSFVVLQNWQSTLKK